MAVEWKKIAYEDDVVTKALFDADTFLYAPTGDSIPVATSPTNVMAALSGHAGAEFLFNSQKIGGVVDPTTDQQVATKKYVDDNIGGVDELSELADVTISGPADIDILQYDNSSSKWVDRTLAEAGIMAKSVYDTDDSGVVDEAEKIDGGLFA